MALINRASLPEEFFDITSATVLKQPEPQYVFAGLAKQALGSAMMLAASMAGGLGISPTRVIPDSGIAYSLPGADRLNLAAVDPSMNNVIIAVAELATPQIGHTVRINRPRFGSGGFTLGNREVASGVSISTIAIDLQSEQVTVTLKRYGGPYDTNQAAVAPLALDRFDASRSVHSIAQVVGMHMQRDFDRWLDTVVAAYLTSGATTLWPNGFLADSASSTAGDMPMDVDLLFRGYETLKLGNIPVFPNGRYRSFITATSARQLKADPQFAAFTQFDLKNLNPVTAVSGIPNAGYITSLPGVDIYESTTLPANANANAVNVFTNIMVGPSMLALGCGQLPLVRFSTDDNFGETAKLVWLAYLGFNLADARFGVQLHTS